VKHIYAWVKENNLRVYVTDRYDKDQILVGDPDCQLRVKRGSNQKKSSEESTGSDQESSLQEAETPGKETKEYRMAAMGLGWLRPSFLALAMWSWLNTPNPSMRMMLPTFAPCMNVPFLH
jgi:hypothetical protein